METRTRHQTIRSLAQEYAAKHALNPAAKPIIKHLKFLADIGIVVTEFQNSTPHQESLVKGFAVQDAVSKLRGAAEFNELLGSFHALENTAPAPVQAPHPYNDYFILPRRHELGLPDSLPDQLEVELATARSFSIWDPFMRKSYLWKIVSKAVKK